MQHSIEAAIPSTLSALVGRQGITAMTPAIRYTAAPIAAQPTSNPMGFQYREPTIGLNG